ncbi:MAG: transglycosylase SLT domain-containing protein [Desulfomonilaceae bacterium]
MNPETTLGTVNVNRLRPLGSPVAVLVLIACVAALAGCGSTNCLVKQDAQYRPAVANAFSRIICLGHKTKKRSPTKPASYPPLPTDENSLVRKFIREYAYGQRSTMKRYLANAAEYLPAVKCATKESGLPSEIAYLVMLESGANPEARSRANALGMWQFMPATARSYGLRVDSWVDERLDPQKSTKAAMLYLKDLYGMFGCWRLALSAYNSGENKLNKVLCQEDASEYDEICSSHRLKRETREFYPRFLAIAHIAKNPGKYGFARLADKAEEPKHELITVDGSHSLEVLAGAIGVPKSRLAELNPALIRGATPRGPSYSLRVPVGKRQLLAAKLKEMPPEPSRRQIVHIVHRGDNLPRLLKRYGIRKSQLASLNPDVNFRRRLHQGQKIVVPVVATRTKRIVRKNKRVSWARDDF